MIKKIIFSIAATLLNCVLVFSQSGAIDLSFNPSDQGYGFNDGADADVSTSALLPDGRIIIGGDVRVYSGNITSYLGCLNPNESIDSGFIPGAGPDFFVRCTSVQSDGKIIVGGEFNTYDGTSRNKIVRINNDGSLDNTFDPGAGASSTVLSTLIQPDGKIIIAGGFFAYNGIVRKRIARLNADGSLDSLFDTGTGANISIYSTALQSDGKIIIGGSFTSFNGTSINKIARLNADGSLDMTFNVGIGFNNTVRAISIQPDGKIIVGGNFTSYNLSAMNHIGRLNADGTTDSTFSPGAGTDNNVLTTSIQTDGKIIIGGDFMFYNNISKNYIVRLNANGSIDTGFNIGIGTNNSVMTTTLQPDGKIIIGGKFTSYNITGKNHVARLNTDGTIDTNYNLGTGANNVVACSAIQSDQKILIAGDLTSYNGVGRNYLARINTDGSIDMGFDPGIGPNGSIVAMALQPDGKIIIGGYFYLFNGLSKVGLARMNPDGSLDSFFSPGQGSDGVSEAIALQPDGKIIVGGSFSTYDGASRNNIARLNSDGTLDSSFTTGSGANSFVSALAIQPDGKIIFSGYFTSYNGAVINRIGRLNSDGTLDTSFNPGSGPSSQVTTLAVQPDGKILVGGLFATFNGVTKNNIVRLNSDGSIDSGFLTGSGTNNILKKILLQPDGKILIGGGFMTFNGVSRKTIARLNPNGTLDNTFNPGAGTYIGVETIAMQADGNLIIGGPFEEYYGTGRNRVARVFNTVSTDVAAASQEITCSVYPNPSGEYVTLTSAHSLNIAVIKILNSIGQVVEQVNGVAGVSCQFDISGYAAGMYFIEVRDGSSISRIKVVKN